MIYRLNTRHDPDPDHAYGEPITIARRATVEASRGPVAVHCFAFADGRAIMHELDKHHRLSATEHPITVHVHGPGSAEAIAASEATDDAMREARAERHREPLALVRRP